MQQTMQKENSLRKFFEDFLIFVLQKSGRKEPLYKLYSALCPPKVQIKRETGLCSSCGLTKTVQQDGNHYFMPCILVGEWRH
jgi:hypothetical protein